MLLAYMCILLLLLLFVVVVTISPKPLSKKQQLENEIDMHRSL
jgi:hypothetical protein